MGVARRLHSLHSFWRRILGGLTPMIVLALSLHALACSTATVNAPIHDPQSTIHNPQSTIDNRAPVVAAGGERLAGAVAGKDSQVVVFRGIPYAAPPVGDLRWKPPAPVKPRPGLQQATEFAPACIQATKSAAFYRHIAQTLGQDPNLIKEISPTSEDCLYLNVWTGNLDSRSSAPVMVWIHGGANANGAGSLPDYEGTNLARKGVVVVTINYRLNVFGFLAHPGLTAESEHRSSGNYALLDQIAALRWVQENIAAFGGDPARVTVFGESAGSTDIGYLLASPLARGLFHRAVMQSGGAGTNDYRTLQQAETVGQGFAEALGVADSKDVAAAMRSKPVEEIQRAWLATKGVRPNAPNIDGWVFPDASARTFEQGKHNQVALMIGFNSDEWTTLRHYWPNVKVAAFHDVLRTTYGPLSDRAMKLYPATTDAEAQAASDRWQTDWYFALPSRFIAERMARSGNPVYFYVFTRNVKAPGGELLGAYHAAEIPFVWDNLAVETFVPRQPYDQELSDAMSGAWVRFAATGDPNGGGLPAWPRFRAGEEGFLEFGDTVRAGSGVRREFGDLYEDLQRARMARGR